MNDTPQTIRAHQADQILELAWDQGPAPTRLPYREIRGACPCASCKDEWTGERLIDVATLRPDLQLTAMEPVGNYAVRLAWNDGHSSGLYTWGLLYQLAAAAAAPSSCSGHDHPHTCSDGSRPVAGRAGCNGHGGCGGGGHHSHG